MASLKERSETAEQRRVRNLLADDRAEHLIPPEALAQGDFADVTVVADDQSQATVKRNRITNPMLALYERGSITEEQFEASVEIARVAEIIAQAVGMRSASLEARVDNSGSAKDLLIEHIGRVRLEATYSKWRDRLPMPKRLVIDMVVEQRPIFATARRYRVGHPRARIWLVRALDRWIELREKLQVEIDEQEVAAAHYRAGGGVLA